MSKIAIYGHRGNRGHLPENSLPAFASAFSAGADGAELDLLLTKDEQIVIYHDPSLNPELCTFLDGSPLPHPLKVRDMTLQQIKQIDCGRKKNPRFPKQSPIPNTPIPTLEELFELIGQQKNKVRLDLEIKQDPEPLKVARIVNQIVKQEQFSSQVFYSSFDPHILSNLRKMDKEAPIYYLYDQEKEDLFTEAAAFTAEGVAPKESLLKSAAEVERLKKRGLKVIAWTVNDESRCEELIRWGVDGIITDYPKEICDFLKTK